MSYNQVKFIVINDNNWEFDHKAPALEWLEEQLYDTHAYYHTVVMTHIPPDNEERFGTRRGENFRGLLKEYFVRLIVSGHRLSYRYTEETLSNGNVIGYYNGDSFGSDGGSYAVFTVTADGISHEVITF